MEKTEIMETKNGLIQGSLERHINIFKGVPYAEPLLAEQRFLKPTPKKNWEGVLECLEYGPDSPQPPEYMERALYGKINRIESESECLTLNVWTPGLDSKKRAVMMWIHGGDYMNGGGNRLMYDGFSLANRCDVVVVTINYRLGALGFLDPSGLHGENADMNVGLWDQIMALKWIKEDISKFGGNPDNITIFGQSAGGLSAVALSTMSIVNEQGLLHKVIAMSIPSYYASDTVKGTQELLDELKIGSENDAISMLKGMPLKKLVKKQAKIYKNSSRIEKTNPWIPNLGGNKYGNKLFKELIEGIGAGRAKDIKFLIGTTMEENKAYSMMDTKAQNMTDETLQTRMKRILKYFGQDEGLVKKFISTYKDSRMEFNLPTDNKEIFDAINTDLWFRLMAIRVAEAQSVHNPDTYSYIFKWKSPAMEGKLGSAHAVDLPFVFGTLSLPGVDNFAGTNEKALSLSEKMMESWTNFAKTGNPNHNGLPLWPIYDLIKRSTMILGKNNEIWEDPLEKERKLWDNIF